MIGHVKVASASPFSSDVKPVEYAGKPPVATADLPDGARCRAVERSLAARLFGAEYIAHDLATPSTLELFS